MLRMLPRIMPGPALMRAKKNGAWVVSIEGNTAAVMVIETRPRGTTLADVDAPLRVYVHLPAGVDARPTGHADVDGEGPLPDEGQHLHHGDHHQVAGHPEHHPRGGLCHVSRDVDLQVLGQLASRGIIELVMAEHS